MCNYFLIDSDIKLNDNLSECHNNNNTTILFSKGTLVIKCSIICKELGVNLSYVDKCLNSRY